MVRRRGLDALLPILAEQTSSWAGEEVGVGFLAEVIDNDRLA